MNTQILRVNYKFSFGRLAESTFVPFGRLRTKNEAVELNASCLERYD